MSTPGSADAASGTAHPNADQDVIAVNGDDEPRGTVNRLDVFDQDGRVLLAQRSPDKRLWDTFWDGTVASHPVEGQTQVEATRGRLVDELGITADQYEEVRVTDRFEYKRYYYDEGVEHEVCTVLKATLSDTDLDPDESEVAGLLWAPYEHLHENPRWYRQLRLCPWFEIAMRRDF
ncbi:MAG: isopentenyl-diphosphate delta-isomerase [Halobacteriales archaeon SW_9_67_24]|nr:MAG: isopentenyl-diphosphate delta-isomerase [Halobacteriales archaeon SW_9_67_24]